MYNRQSTLKKPIDIVIPLGSGSLRNDFELRMAMRSIERFAGNCRNIYVVCSQIPEWLCNVKIIVQADRHKHNKDANIIEKLLTAVDQEDLSSEFIFWSDDQLALKGFDCRYIYPVFNMRSAKDFKSERIWHRRMRNTFEYLADCGKILNWNWESHTPQIMKKELFKKLVGSVDFVSSPGMAVNTLYFGLADTPPMLGQQQLKITLEHAAVWQKIPENKLFLGYNDSALNGNLPELLLKKFPQKSKYEKS